jgi:hypothetical protein
METVERSASSRSWSWPRQSLGCGTASSPRAHVFHRSSSDGFIVGALDVALVAARWAEDLAPEDLMDHVPQLPFEVG